MLKNLKIWQKLLLASVVFLPPMGYLLYVGVQGINYDIRFSQWEIYGDRYQRPLERLLKTISEHGFLTHQYLDSKSDDLKKALRAKEAEVDAAFVELQAIDKELGEALQFTQEGLLKRNRVHTQVKNLLPEWTDLKGKEDSITAAASREKHFHLAADLRSMITHAGDMSNLILDPDLDTYYIMDVTLLALPQSQDRLSSVLMDGYDILKAGGEISSQDRTKLAVYAAMLKEADRERVFTSTNTALNEDKNFYGIVQSFHLDIPLALDVYGDKTKFLIDMLNDIALSPSTTITPAEFSKAGTAAHQASFEFWDKMVASNDALITDRLNGLRKQRLMTYAIAGGSLVLAILLFVFITRRVARDSAA
ncbi:hypothetical protein [Tahibacter amnicola]|uniref:Nitrate/nitrite sensing protein n=1 Tax=Tahibacter amnicola TaxID=2976241 RepID=A0ABY6BJW5_9GAMM|nr:hypothetical protein [Tahibacter amnicola]UXI70052.1 hypothetical protein N4264_10625 [Tahibacter amnicola]